MGLSISSSSMGRFGLSGGNDDVTFEFCCFGTYMGCKGLNFIGKQYNIKYLGPMVLASGLVFGTYCAINRINDFNKKDRDKWEDSSRKVFRCFSSKCQNEKRNHPRKNSCSNKG